MTIALGILLIAMAVYATHHTLRDDWTALTPDDVGKLELAYVTFWTGWLQLSVGVARLAVMP